MTNILNVGRTALAAAQAGLVTTGHNIANASTPGYNRQLVIQGAIAGQNLGFGFIGKGTEVLATRRVYSDFLNNQVLSTQTAKGQLDSYYSQIRQVDNMLANPIAGLSPALQDFFKGVQDMGADPTSSAARQSMLASAETLAARFQSLDGQLREMGQGINDQIASSTNLINIYAKQIAQLNEAIEKATGASDGRQPNDLLDMRDQAISELSKETQVSVVKQGNIYNVYIGTGQPLVVNTKTYNLTTALSPTDPSRVQVAYQNSNGSSTLLSEAAFAGGRLGGLLEFRSKTLDATQNALGRVAIVLASTFNAQHSLGQDQNGAMGGNFFNVAAPLVSPSMRNTGDGVANATISDPSRLTTSDYRMQVTTAASGDDPAVYQITRLSDGKVFSPSPGSVDGVDFSLTGTPAAGDDFLIRPTANGASAALGFSVAISDRSAIAAAAPIRSGATPSNAGNGTISAGSVNTPPPADGNLQKPVIITFTSPTTFSVSGTGTGDPVNVSFTPGADISYNGWTVRIDGAPAEGDTFSVGPNTNGVSDNRNALLLAGLQTASTMDRSTAGSNATTNFQGAYSQLVNLIGNKTRELEVTSKAATQLHTQAFNAQQSVSGVSLDEEAANLLRYQQAYQAAGKVMKTASDLFDVLLSLGR